MNDSLRYGLPFGLAVFFALIVQETWFAHAPTVLRWLVLPLVAHALTLNSLRKRNKAYFPFRYAFLSVFNVTIVATMIVGLLMIVFKQPFVTTLPEEVSETKYLLSVIYFEGMGFVFFSILSGTLLSLIIRNKQHE